MNNQFMRIFSALAAAFAILCVFLFIIFYNEAKDTAIKKLNEEQMIHAKQAAGGIEDFFETWTKNLNSLSKIDEIIDNNNAGKRYMKNYYEDNREQITSITRMNERGIIIQNFPAENSIGTDISGQKHIRDLLRYHRPVISDIFRAVEGFDAVALHVPVYRGSIFRGSIGVLINFRTIARHYLDVIKIGETGYAWVASRDGTLLYSPVPGLVGKSMFEASKGYPSLIEMENTMLRREKGSAIYIYDRIGNQYLGQVKKYAVYMPVNLGDTFWTIAVATAEQDVLSGLISFRNKLAIVIGSIFICGIIFSTLGTKAWLIIKEEEKRRQIENKLIESERNKENLKSILAEKELILKEVHHRIKNNLNTINGLLQLQSMSIKEPAILEAFENVGNRVRGMAVLYDNLSKSSDYKEVPVNEYLPTLIDQIIRNFPNSSSIKIETSITEFRLDTKKAQSIGIIINELLTNIMKYAFAGRKDGLITVQAFVKDNRVSLFIEDNGNGMPPTFNLETSSGSGMRLVTLLAKQLKGSMHIEQTNGTRIALEFEA